MTIVDNNILSAFAKVERLELLPAIFDAVGTPPSVIEELDRAKAAGYEFVERIDAIKSYNDGWLEIVPLTESELELSAEIRDHALSTTDAQCLAVASRRNRRLVTDDSHVGTIGKQHGVAVWDLVLVLQAAIQCGEISDPQELSDLIEDLQTADGYRFATDDKASLFEQFDY